MATITIDSADVTTETKMVAYRAERGGVQSIAGQMYASIARTEEAYVDLETKLGEGGEFEDFAEYHTALQAPVNDAVSLLRSKMADVMALMEQMEATMPAGTILFGVPRAEA